MKEETEKKYEIWNEGYVITGNSADATYLGCYSGKNIRRCLRESIIR